MPLTIDSIKAKLETLRFSPPLSGHSIPLYAGCINAYNTHIVNGLWTLIQENNDSADTLTGKLQEFLTENWTLINGTGLSYTAQPYSSITDVLCDTAVFVAQKRGINIINVLMPTVCIDSIDRRYPDLVPTDEESIKTILREHILGRDGEYLIPIKYLSDYDIGTGFKKIVNPYYDLFSHDEVKVDLSEDEINRLIEHSRVTRQIYDAQQTFENYANDQETLLGQLRLLCSLLRYNSVSGVGSETSAGTGFAPAICNFMSYYDQLVGDSQQVDEAGVVPVPEQVRAEIRSIRMHASNQSLNGNLSSCLSTRRTALEAAMAGQEEVLASIRLSAETRETLVKEAHEQLTAARAALVTSLVEVNCGFDKLGIPLNLIRQFNPHLIFNSLDDLDTFNFLPPDEIQAFCSDDNYKKSIVRAVGSLENLVILSNQFAPERLVGFLNGLGPLLKETYFCTGKSYASVLMILNQERRDAYWQQYQNDLPRITSAVDVSSVFSVLTEPQQSLLYEAMKPFWREKLIYIFNLASAIKDFKPVWRLEVFQIFKEAQLEQAKPDDLLSQEKLGRLYEDLERKIENMSEKGSNFELALCWAYGKGLVKIAAFPGIKKYGFSRYESSSAFFSAVGAPAVCCGLALAAAVGAVACAVNGLHHLLHGDLSQSLIIVFAPLILCVAAILAAVSVLMAVLILPATMIRCSVTAGSYLAGGYATSEPGRDIKSSAVPIPSNEGGVQSEITVPQFSFN